MGTEPGENLQSAFDAIRGDYVYLETAPTVVRVQIDSGGERCWRVASGQLEEFITRAEWLDVVISGRPWPAKEVLGLLPEPGSETSLTITLGEACLLDGLAGIRGTQPLAEVNLCLDLRDEQIENEDAVARSERCYVERFAQLQRDAGLLSNCTFRILGLGNESVKLAGLSSDGSNVARSDIPSDLFGLCREDLHATDLPAELQMLLPNTLLPDGLYSAAPPDVAQKVLCDRPWRALTIRPNGEAGTCCFLSDPDVNTFGNMQYQDAHSLWNSPNAMYVREQMLSDPLPELCCNCPKYSHRERHLFSDPTQASKVLMGKAVRSIRLACARSNRWFIAAVGLGPEDEDARNNVRLNMKLGALANSVAASLQLDRRGETS